jgi:hypothetical protein
VVPYDDACGDCLAWQRWGDYEFACHLCGDDGRRVAAMKPVPTIGTRPQEYDATLAMLQAHHRVDRKARSPNPTTPGMPARADRG